LYGNDNFFEQDLGFNFDFCFIGLVYGLDTKPTGKKLLCKVMAGPGAVGQLDYRSGETGIQSRIIIQLILKLYIFMNVIYPSLGKLDLQFFNRKDVVRIARELIGKVLFTSFDGRPTSGRIIETEAYAGITDRASHAYGGRRTERTEIMYKKAGTSYVYLCYGIHHLFNIITNKENIPHAILIRGLEPMDGIETMMRRTGKKRFDQTLTKGPGNLSKALGLTTKHSGRTLFDDEIFIGEDGFIASAADIIVTTRIGVEYAGPDAQLPYRFFLKGNPFVSGKKGNKGK
jgi:DNA-3-methyladenine glycosylase